MIKPETLRRITEAFMVAVCVCALLFAKQWKYGYNLGDEGWLWYVSQRIQFGDMPIRDFFSYDPGRYLWSAAWFKVLGTDGLFEQRMANAAFGVLGLVFAYASMAWTGIKRSMRLIVIAAMALALCYPQHKVYEQSLSLIGVVAIACALHRPADQRLWLVLGLFTGIAAIVGRNSGVYILAASAAALASAWWTAGQLNSIIRTAFAYGFGVLLGYLPMLLWLLLDVRFRSAMIESVLFTSEWRITLPIPFPWSVKQDLSSVAAMQGTVLSWLMVLVLGLYLVNGVRLLKATADRQASTPRHALEIAALFVGVAYLYQAFSRADFAHVAQSIMPLFLLMASRLDAASHITDRIAGSLFFVVSMIAWLPNEPIARAWLLEHTQPGILRRFSIDGRSFVLDNGTIALLESSRRVATACQVKDGQLLAMPHYPGILAYLHIRSPYWELYYLFPRSAAFQQQEIDQLESAETKVALVDWSVALDGREDLRFQALNPLLAKYIKSHFRETPAYIADVAGPSVMVRDCYDQTAGKDSAL